MGQPRSKQQYANYDQLSQLFSTTSAWLQTHGDLAYGDQGREVEGLFDGLPLMRQAAPDFEFNVSCEALTDKAPTLCESLQLGDDSLRLNYFLPAYTYYDFNESELEHGVTPDFLEPAVHFVLDKSEQSGLYDEYFILTESSVLNGLVRMCRITRKLIPSKTAYTMIGHLERNNLDPGDIGSMTLNEYELLSGIVQVLRTHGPDEMRAGTHWSDHIDLM